MRRRLVACLALAASCGGGSGDRKGGGGDDLADGSPGLAPDSASPLGRIEVTVDGDAAWTGSGMSVARGELVRVMASGAITFDSETEVGPAGFQPDEHDQYNALRCADHAALIARVDEGGGAFLVAAEELILAPRAGGLALGPNDTRTSDNTGAFAVVLEPAQPVEIIEQRSVTVPGSATWIDTGIDVIPDHLIAIDADGQVDNNVPGGQVGPEGVPDSADDPYNLLACADHMSLIGRIGVGGEPFAVGRDLSRRAAASGRLFLRVNHRVPDGNTGKFSAGVLIAR